MNKIKLTDSIFIKKGNFSFVYDVTGDVNLYETCLVAEKNIYINEDACQLALRKAYEGFGRYFQIRAEINNGLSEKDAIQKTEESIEYNPSQSYQPSYKKMFIKYVNKDYNYKRKKNNDKQYEKLLNDYKAHYPMSEKKEEIVSLSDFLIDIYARLSNPMHFNKSIDNDCYIITRLFFELILILLKTDVKFDKKLIPYDEYYPITENTSAKLGLTIDNYTRVYVNENNKYFLFKRNEDYNGNVSNNKLYAREIEVLDKLWDAEHDSPNNIPLSYGEIGIEGSSYKIYAFPSRPFCLNNPDNNELFISNRHDIAYGLIKAIYSLQNRDNPIILRTLNKKSIFVCENKGGAKVYIVRFNTAKITEYDSAFTVKDSISNIIDNGYIAPEIQEDNANLKSDIYSLGKILFDLYSETNDTYELGIIKNMCNKNPEQRPSIHEVYGIWKASTVKATSKLYAYVFTYPYELISYPITDKTEIGRLTETGIKIPSKIVSRNHGMIYKENEQYVFQDVDSTNGTYINDKLYGKGNENKKTTITSGTVIRIDHSEHNNPHKEAVIIIISSFDENNATFKFTQFRNEPLVLNGKVQIFLEQSKVYAQTNNDMVYHINGNDVCGRKEVNKLDVIGNGNMYAIIVENGIYIYDFDEEMRTI